MSADPNGKDFNVIEYLESLQKAAVDNAWQLAQTGGNEDSVKLKANQLILNKLIPDRTKMDLDIKSNAPYDLLLKNLSCEKPKKKK